MNISSVELLAKAEQLLDARELRAALRLFQAAEHHGADANRCAAGRWMAHMLRGDFPAAWRESDAIRARGAAGPDCLWRGEDIRGKRVIVRCLHGYGDAVQFLRYAPRLKAMAKQVIWEVPPALVDAAPYFCGVDRVITWSSRSSSAVDWEVQAEVMELPCILRSHIAELPVATNYLRLPGELLASTAAQMGRRTAPRVGVVWTAGEWNLSRSIPLGTFRQFFKTGDCEFWNLQGGAVRAEWDQFRNCGALRDAASCDNGILALASVIAQLDLVVTVDTLAAHLAGALGVPAWLMLRHQADSRWMVNRNDSPWYPSLRLFRQPSPGDWKSVVESAGEALRNRASFQTEGIAA
jgi:hypothetical protein